MLARSAGRRRARSSALAGIDSREAAEALRGQSLELRDERRCPSPRRTRSGCSTWSACERAERERAGSGWCATCSSGPANDVLVVRPAAGDELLVPFTATPCPTVDVAGASLEVDPAFVEEGPAA